MSHHTFYDKCKSPRVDVNTLTTIQGGTRAAWNPQAFTGEDELSMTHSTSSWLAKARVLLVDKHGGPMADMMWNLLRIVRAPLEPESLDACRSVDRSMLAGHCLDLNVPKESWKDINGLRRELEKDYPYYGTQQQQEDVVASLRSKYLEQLQVYDVFICSFPSRECAVLHKMGLRVIFHFSHRFLHHMGAAHRPLPNNTAPLWLKQFVDQLYYEGRAGMKSKRMLVSANNPYDFMHIYHAVGIKPFPWPDFSHLLPLSTLSEPAKDPAPKSVEGKARFLLWPGKVSIGAGWHTFLRNLEREGNSMKTFDLKQTRWCIFTWGQVCPRNSSDLCDHEVVPENGCYEHDEGKRPEELEFDKGNVAVIQKHIAHFAYIEKLEGPNLILEYHSKNEKSIAILKEQYQAAVILPYSLHSASFADTYFGLNMPHLVPSLRFLAQLHKTLGVVLHKTPDNNPCLPQDFHIDLRNHHTSPCCGTSSERCDSPVEHVERWLAFSELYQLPNLIHYDSYFHLTELLSKLAQHGTPSSRMLPLISKQIKSDTERFINQTHTRVLQVLGHMLQHLQQ